MVVGDVQCQQRGEDVDAVLGELDKLVVGQVQGQQTQEFTEVLRQFRDVVVAEVEVHQVGSHGQTLTADR